MINGLSMSKIDWVSKFEEFLIENDCYSEFVIRLLEHSNKSLSEYINDSIYKQDLVIRAFSWGKPFWSDIHFKWSDRFNEILKDN